jgi:hypothetical protein
MTTSGQVTHSSGRIGYASGKLTYNRVTVEVFVTEFMAPNCTRWRLYRQVNRAHLSVSDSAI